MKKIILCSLFIFFNSSAQFSGPIFGGDFDHNPNYRRRLDPISEPVSNCSISRNGENYNLNKKQYTLDELFSLVSEVESAREIVSTIKEMISHNRLKIVNLTSYIRQKRGLSHKTAALYDFTTEVPTIFLSFNDELGLAAHFFVHEATHALDELIPQEYEVDMVYYRSFKEFQKLFGLDVEPMKELSEYESSIMNDVWKAKKSSQDRHAYRAERYAFDVQGDFTEAITDFDDCYVSYLNEHRKKNGLKLYSNTPDKHIFDSYRIDKLNIKRD